MRLRIARYVAFQLLPAMLAQPLFLSLTLMISDEVQVWYTCHVTLLLGKTVRTIWCDLVPGDILLGRPWISMGSGTIHIRLFTIEKLSHYTSFKVGPTNERFEG